MLGAPIGPVLPIIDELDVVPTVVYFHLVCASLAIVFIPIPDYFSCQFLWEIWLCSIWEDYFFTWVFWELESNFLQFVCKLDLMLWHSSCVLT